MTKSTKIRARHLLFLVPTLLLAAGGGKAQEPFRWRGRIPAGEAVEVRGIVGDIRAEPASGSEVEVVAVKRAGRHGDPEDVRIETVRKGSGVLVCAVYPSRRGERRGERSGARGECDSRIEIGPDEQNDTRVDFTVRVPAGVRLVARNVAGDVEALSLRGPVEVSSVSGDVRVSTSAWGEASTVSGDVEARLGSTGSDGTLRFRTVSGDVSVELPAGVDAEVRASTMSGRVTSDFTLEESRGFMHHRARGTLGRGGRRVEIETVSGNVRLRRGS
jgi:hypothetical protein